MISIIAVMPFYFTDGYGRIGTNKYEFFYKETILMGKAILPVLCVFWLVLLWRRSTRWRMLNQNSSARTSTSSS